MSSHSIFWPVLLQIFLTLTLFVVLGMKKASAVKAGAVDRKQAALDNRAWPATVVKVSNNIANQFETPMLFYLLCVLLYSMDAVGMVALVLAWVFALSRVAHAYVHIGSNYVPMRLRLFLVGCFVLIAMLLLAVWNLAVNMVSV